MDSESKRDSSKTISQAPLLLEPTNERIDDDEEPGSFVLDSQGMLGVSYLALRLTVGQLVRAINALHGKSQALETQAGEQQESLNALEQQISMSEARIRECEDTCQQVRIEVGTMGFGPQDGSEDEDSDAAEQELKMNERLEAFAEKLDQVEKSHASVIARIDVQFDDCDGWLQRLQDALDVDLAQRLQGLDDSVTALRAEGVVLRRNHEDHVIKKADRTEVLSLREQIEALLSGQKADHEMLTDARRNFKKLDDLVNLVDESQVRMTEISRALRDESSELRGWAANGLSELKKSLRGKMDERAGAQALETVSKEIRDLRPSVSEAAQKAHEGLRFKAEASHVTRLTEIVEDLSTHVSRPGQLLIGTKCLACDRVVSKADFTDEGRISLHKSRQQEELFHEVEKSIHRAQSRGDAGGGEVLKFVAVHVGSPERTKAGHSVFDTRSPPSSTSINRECSPGALSLAKVKEPPRRPWTSPASDGASTARSAAREVPPIVRCSPRSASEWQSRISPPSRGRGSLSRRLRPGAGTTVRGALGHDGPLHSAARPGGVRRAPPSPDGSDGSQDD